MHRNEGVGNRACDEPMMLATNRSCQAEPERRGIDTGPCGAGQCDILHGDQSETMMAFYDGILRALGGTPEVDRNEAAVAEIDRIRRDRDPASVFAIRNADALAAMPDSDLRRTLPMIAHDRIPVGGAQREALVAVTLRTYGEAFLERGDDKGMAPLLARAVRQHALGTIDGGDLTQGPARRLSEVVAERAADVGRITGSYLATGKAHEDALDAAALRVVEDPIRISHLRSNTGHVLEPIAAPGDADRRLGWDSNQADHGDALRWTREALATEVALARGGALKPDEIVRAAHGNPAQAKLLLDADARGLAAVHPNFEAGRKVQPHEMASLVDRFLSSPERPGIAAQVKLGHAPQAGASRPDPMRGTFRSAHSAALVTQAMGPER